MNRFSHATSKWGAGAEERCPMELARFHDLLRRAPAGGRLRCGQAVGRRGPQLTWTSPWHVPVPERSFSPGPTMSTNHLGQRLRHIATQWPADPLRPKLQLKTFLAALAEHPALSPTAVAATNALYQNRVSGHVSEPCSFGFHGRESPLEIFRSPFRKRC